MAPRLLCFDVFGTVVDWRGSIVAEVSALANSRALSLDAEAFVDAWRLGYPKAMDEVRRGVLPWTRIDDLHRMILDKLIAQFSLESLSERERRDLNFAWHRLKPWPDSVEGLTRLKRKFIIVPLSNGNVSLLTNLAKFAGLPWDAILSAELFHAYKPDAAVYDGAARMMDVPPVQAMLVAAHKSDLTAAAARGFMTAFVDRRLEYGEGRHPDPGGDPAFNFNVTSFIELADALGA